MLKRSLPLLFAICALGFSPAAFADSANNSRNAKIIKRGELPPYLQCVPYAREQSGVKIFGDAHTWWGQAKGRYVRGNKPKVGAVMAFAPHRKMRLGHVAAVSRIIDSRTVLLNHSNWSPLNGRRGQIERNVKAIDVSPNNDWSQVRVWYHPIQGLGKTVWPVRGFIYSKNAPKGAPKGMIKKAPKRTFSAARTNAPRYSNARTNVARITAPRANNVRANNVQVSPPEQWIKRTITAPARQQATPAFAKAFGSLGTPAKASSAQRRTVRSQPVQRKAVPRRAAPTRKATPYSARKASPYPVKKQQVSRKPTSRTDPLEAVLSRYED